MWLSTCIYELHTLYLTPVVQELDYAIREHRKKNCKTMSSQTLFVSQECAVAADSWAWFECLYLVSFDVKEETSHIPSYMLHCVAHWENPTCIVEPFEIVRAANTAPDKCAQWPQQSMTNWNPEFCPLIRISFGVVMPLNALYGYYVFDHLEEVQLLCIGVLKVDSWIMAFILVPK